MLWEISNQIFMNHVQYEGEAGIIKVNVGE
jgi:hypothetical protein